ncbi:MAG: peptidase M28 family protein, partial [Flavobacteriales bacterium]
MRKSLFTFAMAALPLILVAQKDSLQLSKIYGTALSNGKCYDHLRTLCKDIGPRLSGSPAADKAILWGKDIMESLGADTVYLQDVQVPHWVRGDQEKATAQIDGVTQAIRICALGGSVGTNGILSAEVIQVKRLEELEELGRDQIEGKIVLFNRALDPMLINTGMAYGGAYDQRSYGASEASKFGAVGVLIRSLTHALDTKPHTGSMGYEEGVTQIPAAAISTV